MGHPGISGPSQWDTGTGGTVGIWALCQGRCGSSRDILFHPNGTQGWEGQSGSGPLAKDGVGHPGISCSIPMGHRDGTVWVIPGYPVPSQWDTGTGSTVGIRAFGQGQCGSSRDILFHLNGTPGWGRTVGIRALGQDSVGHPGISYSIPVGHWDGKDSRDKGLGPGQCGSSLDILFHPSGTLGQDSEGYPRLYPVAMLLLCLI